MDISLGSLSEIGVGKGDAAFLLQCCALFKRFQSRYIAPCHCSAIAAVVRAMLWGVGRYGLLGFWNGDASQHFKYTYVLANEH